MGEVFNGTNSSRCRLASPFDDDRRSKQSKPVVIVVIVVQSRKHRMAASACYFSCFFGLLCGGNQKIAAAIGGVGNSQSGCYFRPFLPAGLLLFFPHAVLAVWFWRHPTFVIPAFFGAKHVV